MGSLDCARRHVSLLTHRREKIQVKRRFDDDLTTVEREIIIIEYMCTMEISRIPDIPMLMRIDKWIHLYNNLTFCM